MENSTAPRNSKISEKPMVLSTLPVPPIIHNETGRSERMVQKLKNILTKSDEEGGYLYLELLSYRATPIDHNLN